MPQKKTTPTTELARASVGMNEHGIQLRSMDDLARWCDTVAKSGLAPSGLDTPAKVAVAVQTGLEAGLTPMAALRSVVVVNGRPSWYGEAALSLIRRSKVCSRGPEVGVEGEGESRAGFCRFTRDGQPFETRFTVADAKRARLWGKAGPWTAAPDDMLLWRAVSRAGKRYFSDVLMGLTVDREVADYADAPPATLKDAAPPTESDPLFADADAEPTSKEPANLLYPKRGPADDEMPDDHPDVVDAGEQDLFFPEEKVPE